MDELEQALNGSRLTDDDDDVDHDHKDDVYYDHNMLSDNDKNLIQNSIELIKVLTSYDIIDQVILLLLFRSVQNV